MKKLLFIAGILLLLAAEFMKVYLIMPFPGSQQKSTVEWAYFLHTNIWWIRIIGLLMVIPHLLYVFRNKGKWAKTGTLIPLILYGILFYLCNYKFLADKMFLQIEHKQLLPASQNKVAAQQTVIGVFYKGEARCYPVELIGYHHQVMDTMAGDPVMVTYCTVCHTGRVYSPVINNKTAHFRLVGMDQFNAMFEDADTKSWWQQATGMAIAGKLKGTKLKEIPSEQLSLSEWTALHPTTLILQPDTVFSKKYAELKGYNEGTISSSLEKRDSASWQKKSWVIGVVDGNKFYAFDWNELQKQQMLQQENVLLVLEKDNTSFHAYSRKVDSLQLGFKWASPEHFLFSDSATSTTWNLYGIAIEGTLKGKKLVPLQSYQEFWHSWATFHPGTIKVP